VVIDKEAETCCDDGNCCRTETTLVQINDEALSSTAVAAPAIITTQLFIQAFIELISSIVPEVNKVEYVEFISPPPPKMQTVLSGLQTYLL
ncbi:MAG: hypothetical protein PF541_18255, partial [Prolixibacteraceae bacterium]|nr:hypothetical protein [Prolixibacteraceae bacterium]